jgi:excisionase family DNA binding protein
MRTDTQNNGARGEGMDKSVEASTGAAWLTYKQAQEYANIGRTKMTELVNTGEVKAARVGRAVRINRESLEDYMERQVTQLKLPGFDEAAL